MGEGMKRFHPLTLLVIVLWLSSMAILMSAPLKLVVLFLLSVLGVMLFNGSEPLVLLRSFRKLLPLLAIVFVIQVLATGSGNDLVSLGFTAITDMGIVRGVSIMLRLSVIFLAAKILARMSYVEYDDAFKKLGFPDEVGFMVAYAAHLVPGISQSIKSKRSLLTSRGISIKLLPLKDKMKVFRVIALDIAGNLLRNVDTRAIALELRGFRSAGRSTRLITASLGLADALCMLLLIALSQTIYVL